MITLGEVFDITCDVVHLDLTVLSASGETTKHYERPDVHQMPPELLRADVQRMSSWRSAHGTNLRCRVALPWSATHCDDKYKK